MRACSLAAMAPDAMSAGEGTAKLSAGKQPHATATASREAHRGFFMVFPFLDIQNSSGYFPASSKPFNEIRSQK